MDVSGDAFSNTITASDARRLYFYWLKRRGTRRFPSPKDIEPLDLGFVLGRISLIEISGNPRRFHYALVSAELTRHLGYSMTDKSVDEIPEPRTREYVSALYNRAIEAGEPLYEAGTVILDRRVWQHKTLTLPLSSDGETIDMLLVFRSTDIPKKI